jgi:hypothetical protein
MTPKRTDMDYPEAMALKRVRRAAWKRVAYVEAATEGRCKMLVLVQHNGVAGPYVASSCDQFAKDWMLIEEAP